MAYTALELINRAYFLSGVVSYRFQEVSGPQAKEGLYLLNSILQSATPNSRLIPYWDRHAFVLSYGVERYFIENLAENETFTFNIGPIRYPVMPSTRDAYFGTARVDNITSIPSIYLTEKTLGGMYIYVYPLPAQNYPAQITGKFALTNVTLTSDLLLSYDEYYINNYLRYALGNEICLENNIEFTPEKKQRLEELVEQLSWRSPPDLTMKKLPLINRHAGGISYQQANIGKGFFP